MYNSLHYLLKFHFIKKTYHNNSYYYYYTCEAMYSKVLIQHTKIKINHDWLVCSELFEIVDFEKSLSSPYSVPLLLTLALSFKSSESDSSSYSELLDAEELVEEQQHSSLLICKHRVLEDAHRRFLTFFVKPQKRMALASP